MRPTLAAARPAALAALAVLAAPAAPAAAQTRQHGDLVYDIPAGWSVHGDADGFRYLAVGAGAGCPSCYVGLGLPEPAAGPIEDWLAAEALGYLSDANRPSAVVAKPARVIAAEPRPLAFTQIDAGGYVVMAMAARTAAGYQFMAFEGEGADPAAREATLAFFQGEVRPFLDALRFVSEGADPLMPPAEPGNMDGVLWGWQTYTTYGLDWMPDMTMLYRTLVFWPDGRFYEGTPPGGTRPPDEGGLRAAGDPNWGTYREAGGALDLRWVDGRAERLDPLDVEGAWWDGYFALYLVEAVADGTVLDGTIGWTDFEGFSPTGDIQGGMSSGASTTFRPDGTFQGSSYDYAYGNLLESDGDMSNMTGDVAGGFAGGGEAPGWRGTYAVRDGLVVMTPADGSAPSSMLALRVGDGIVIGDMDLSGPATDPAAAE